MQKNVSNMHYHVQDTVLYGQSGVCRIADIAEGRGRRPAGLLRPAAGFRGIGHHFRAGGQRGADSENAAGDVRGGNHRPHRRHAGGGFLWIADDNARRERYKAILAGGDPSDLIRLIKTLYLRAQTQKAQNKKPRLEDERFMKQAEKLLYEEFAHVLHIRRDEVLPYILHRVNGSTPSNIKRPRRWARPF